MLLHMNQIDKKKLSPHQKNMNMDNRANIKYLINRRFNLGYIKILSDRFYPKIGLSYH